MKDIILDAETFASVDLAKCGVYKYAAADDFEILLLSYSIDYGEVQVIDLASGEQIPDEVLGAILDPKVIKHAFNASFERVCLSFWLARRGMLPSDEFGIPKFLSAEGWHCDMVWCAYLSLPLSLEKAGAVLKVEQQKMKEGKDLIKYFCIPCKPTKTNGGRIRNLPGDDPEKWRLFKAYNKRDVETEIAIERRLSKVPVPDHIWKEYTLDQQINDHGVLIDLDLVEAAMKLDEQSRDGLVKEMCSLTMLDNPNSVVQLKGWLAEKGYEVESLGKKEVEKMLEDAPTEIAKVLGLRLQLAKSSIKKYQAMENYAGKDGRARGLFQFYGAVRTGRWCLTGDHEVLTDNGWERLDEWKGGRIACWNANTEAISFQRAEHLEFDYCGDLYLYEDGRISQLSTPDHKMRAVGSYGKQWRDMIVEEMSRCSAPCIPLTGYRYHRGCANPLWIRVLIMVQADGSYCEDGQIRFRFKKKRKIERCKALLRRAEIMFTVREYEGGSITEFIIPARAVPLWLRQFRTKTFGYWLLDENPDIFFDELPNWDGYYPAPNSIQYATTNKQNADIVQALAHLSGRTCSMKIKHRPEHPEWKDAYYLNIWLNPGNCHAIKKKPQIQPFEGKVYCAETKTGYFLVRRNGKVWITGNSGRGVQLQNLKRNDLPDLSEARELVKSGNGAAVELLYDSIPDTLSQLVRTALIPEPGKKFIVADFSAIEARVLSWLAGETWRMETFASGGDIYCATAGKMFHCNVVKHGENGELRQKGKQAELACGYGGSVGAMKAMGALDMGMQEEELKPLVDAWRAANPRIVDFWWDVDEAVKECVRTKERTAVRNIGFRYQSGMLFIDLPSGRSLVYIKPRIEENDFGGESITYMGIGTTKKWERLESYGPKFVENIVQGIARDLLIESMERMGDMKIVAHVHDEVIVEAKMSDEVKEICNLMSELPDWVGELVLSADGDEYGFYRKS